MNNPLEKPTRPWGGRKMMSQTKKYEALEIDVFDTIEANCSGDVLEFAVKLVNKSRRLDEVIVECERLKSLDKKVISQPSNPDEIDIKQASYDRLEVERAVLKIAKGEKRMSDVALNIAQNLQAKAERFGAMTEEYVKAKGEASGLRQRLDAVIAECERINALASTTPISHINCDILQILKIAKGETK